jgi:hypothetical protein
MRRNGSFVDAHRKNRTMQRSSDFRLLTLFVRAGTATYPDSERQLNDLFASQLPGLQRDVLVVDNLLPPGVHERSTGRTVIGGDNSSWEFSAVDVAVTHLAESVTQYDIVNVVTSAFGQLYTAYLDRFRPDVVEVIRGKPVCLGHIDCYNSGVSIMSYRSQHWLRSCFLMLPVTELLVLGSFVSARCRTPWFSGRAEDPFAADAPLCDTYKRYLLDWLLGQDIGQGVKWHRSMSLDQASIETFELKARAILNEHLLGLRFRAAGCRLIDVTWLSAVLSAGRAVRWDTPWWTQLSERDRDAISVRPTLASDPDIA